MRLFYLLWQSGGFECYHMQWWAMASIVVIAIEVVIKDSVFFHIYRYWGSVIEVPVSAHS